MAGFGFRDHSWGPRKWQAPDWWRWFLCLFDDRNGFAVWVVKAGDARPPGNGIVLRDGRASMIRRVDVKSAYGPAPHYPTTMAVTLTTDDGSFDVRGEALPNIVPLRHRREGSTARIAELICRFEFEGLSGHGFAEYHDLMVGGIPAGMTEA